MEYIHDLVNCNHDLPTYTDKKCMNLLFYNHYTVLVTVFVITEEVKMFTVLCILYITKYNLISLLVHSSCFDTASNG